MLYHARWTVIEDAFPELQIGVRIRQPLNGGHNSRLRSPHTRGGEILYIGKAEAVRYCGVTECQLEKWSIIFLAASSAEPRWAKLLALVLVLVRKMICKQADKTTRNEGRKTCAWRRRGLPGCACVAAIAELMKSSLNIYCHHRYHCWNKPHSIFCFFTLTDTRLLRILKCVRWYERWLTI